MSETGAQALAFLTFLMGLTVGSWSTSVPHPWRYRALCALALVVGAVAALFVQISVDM